MATTEQRAEQRARKKALAALRAFDLEQGKVYVGEWNAPVEVIQQVGLSEKAIKKLQNDRARLLVAKLPHLLKVIRPAKAVKVHTPALEFAHVLPVFDSVICDWLTISHSLRFPHPPINDGQILKLNRDGSREWTSECWQTLKCPSSDTSLRIKCDGDKFMMTGNIGRFGETDNLNGYTVSQCVARWRKILLEEYPKFNIFEFFGEDFERINTDTGVIESHGTRITRCDLAGNLYTDNFAALSAQCMTHKVNRIQPRMGKYGPQWGYDAKRANWLKAKLYDKSCELAGRRVPASGETVARFEVQLGSEILKRKGLSVANGWKENDMENVIFAQFSDQVFKGQTTAENWMDIPPRLRCYAICWRDGVPVRNQTNSERSCRRVLLLLREYGIDASQPCNIVTLTQRIEVVKVQPLQARRFA